MSTQVAQQQHQKDPSSGHVCTLTPDQRTLLHQFWTRVLDICALADGAGAVYKNGTANKSSSKNDKYNELAELKSALEKYTPKQLRRAFWRLVLSDDPDVVLLRFLRARKWDQHKALAMLVCTLKWTLEINIEKIVMGGEQGTKQYFKEKGIKGFEVQLTSGKSFCRGFDKEGRPICYINVRHHRKDEQPLEVLQLFTLWVMETTRLMVQSPVETGCIVFDMTGFSLANMDMTYVKFMVQCFEAYYPESLGICLVHKAPWVFGTVWKLISPLLDPAVASKVKFTREDSDLLEYISAENLISGLGGQDTWEYKYVPPRDDEDYRLQDEATRQQKWAARQALETQFDEITKRWNSDPDDEQLDSEREKLKTQLRAAQLELDPYIRSRTYYHRTGVLGEDGSCDWSKAKSE